MPLSPFIHVCIYVSWCMGIYEVSIQMFSGLLQEDTNAESVLRTSGFVQSTLIPQARKLSPEQQSYLSQDRTVFWQRSSLLHKKPLQVNKELLRKRRLGGQERSGSKRQKGHGPNCLVPLKGQIENPAFGSPSKLLRLLKSTF